MTRSESAISRAAGWCPLRVPLTDTGSHQLATPSGGRKQRRSAGKSSISSVQSCSDPPRPPSRTSRANPHARLGSDRPRMGGRWTPRRKHHARQQGLGRSRRGHYRQGSRSAGPRSRRHDPHTGLPRHCLNDGCPRSRTDRAATRAEQTTAARPSGLRRRARSQARWVDGVAGKKRRVAHPTG
jgi:hypothetical protein